VYVSCELSVRFVELGVAGLVPAEPYTVSLTEVVEDVLTLPPALPLTEVVEDVPTLPPALPLTEVVEGAPEVLYTVAVNTNVPGESSISLGCNDLLTSSVTGPSITYVSDGVSLRIMLGLPVTLYV
jgi:hypothetical protein